MKQAVVYIVDASSTMEDMRLSDGSVCFEMAKRHLTQHYGTMLQHSAASLSSIILAGTVGTSNHKCVMDPKQHDDHDDDRDNDNDEHDNDNDNDNDDDDDDDDASEQHPDHISNDFTHLTELSFGLSKNSLSILRTWQYQRADTYHDNNNNNKRDTPSKQQQHDNERKGTILHALRLAQATMESNTAGKKFQRCVRVYTDTAGHDYEMSLATLQETIAGLQALECPVHVYSFQSMVDAITIKHEQQEQASSSTLPITVPAPPKSDGTAAQTNIKLNQKEEDVPLFQTSAMDAEQSTKETSRPRKRVKQEDSSDDNSDSYAQPHREVVQDDQQRDTEEEEEEEEEDVVILDTRQARDEFLQNIAKQTNGSFSAVWSAEDLPMPEILQKDPHYSKTTLLLTPAKGADVSKEPYALPVRLSLMHAKQGAPTLKKGFVLETTHPQNNNDDVVAVDKNKMTTSPTAIGDTEKLIQYVDLDDPDGTPVDRRLTVDAVRYGSEWKVVDQAFEYATTPKDMPGPAIQILCYMHAEALPSVYCQGPCHAVTGHDSIRSCAAVSALAQALRETQKVALVLVAKTKVVKATALGALVPGPQNQLYMITLPYSGEAKHMAADDWLDEKDDEEEEEEQDDDDRGNVESDEGKDEEHGEKNAEVQTAIDLIDALWLTDDQAESILTQSDPFQRAWKQTVLHRAIHPGSTELIFPRSVDPQDDPLATPINVKESAQNIINQFHQTFPLVLKSSTDKEKKKKGSKALTYSNFLDEDE